MQGILVNVKSPIDSVRIESLGEGRAVTIPASLLLNVDDNLREVRLNGACLLVYKTGENQWMAECGGTFWGEGASPIQAIANMSTSPRGW